MPFLSKLFGKSEPTGAPSETHKGFTITPQSVKEGGQYRLTALIEKDGKSHELIRADHFASADEANAAALTKARMLIDQIGDGLFRG
ncbi:HlyU family transcriptional regulator [Dinoroseobacter sp. S124A]|uniref:HlyU family transcriptional regulator n=1 Tax=Dinoroseobacter sp. S124A TaxID=3415128 RepID=UPI003C79C2B4